MTRNFAVKAVHKQMYPATHNFIAEVDDSVPSGWTDASGDGCTATIITSLNGHRKVLKMDDQSAVNSAIISLDFTAELDSTVEFWIAKSSIGAGNDLSFRIYEGANPIVFLYFSDDNLEYFDSLDAVHVVDTDFFTAINTLVHIKLILDDTANTFACYRNDVLLDAALEFNNNSTTGIDSLLINSRDNHTGYTYYFDAFGFSWDTDYNIGDNVHWRHYQDQDSDFESNDVGDEPTGWTSSNNATCTTTIEPFFNEHKKVLKLYDGNAAGVYTIEKDFAASQEDGAIEFWIRTADNTKKNYVMLYTAADSESIKYDLNSIVGVGDDTWYHIKLVFDCTPDTYDIWLDNILITADIAFDINAVDVRTIVFESDAGEVITNYVDAISFSWNNEVGDNRIFDYNDAYTKTDITTNVRDVVYTNEYHRWRTASLFSNEDYEASEIFLHVYDIKSVLALEAEITNRIQRSKVREYLLLDKNYDDLTTLGSNTFSADKIHDPTDSTSMLKVILPNVSESDGDLILVNADTKTDTYSPVTKNYPLLEILRDISDLADSSVIIEANGKVHLDDDLASGEDLDFDTKAEHAQMLGEPIVNDILDSINYFEIFGAINPDTGTRFYKITDNSGTDKKRKWRITNNSFRTQTDVDNYAAKLVSKLVSVKEITITVQGLGTHNMGETFLYKYDNNEYTIPYAAYYIVREDVDFDTARSTIVLSEGLIEGSKYAAGFERPQNYSDAFASEIYETDINTINLNIWSSTGTITPNGWILTTNDVIYTNFYITSRVDVDRDITIDFLWYDAHLTVDGELTVTRFPCDGSTGGTPIEAAINHDVVVTVDARHQNTSYTLAAADVVVDNIVRIHWENKDADSVQSTAIQVQYYVKRTV